MSVLTALRRALSHPRKACSLKRRLVLQPFEDRLCPNAAELAFSTYLGGSADDQGMAIAVDTAGNSYVAGGTFSGFPATPGAYDTTYNGGHDCFVAKFAP